MGTSVYMSWKSDGALRADERWRVDELTMTLFRHLPDAGRTELARATQVRAVQDDLATSLTRATAAVCAGIGAAPIPFADTIPLTGLQAGLVAGIAWIGGRSIDKRGAGEFVGALSANVGVAFLLREGFRQLMKVIAPGGGAIISATVAFSGTMAIGAAAKAYYIHGVSLEKARRIFRKKESEKNG